MHGVDIELLGVHEAYDALLTEDFEVDHGGSLDVGCHLALIGAVIGQVCALDAQGPAVRIWHMDGFDPLVLGVGNFVDG